MNDCKNKEANARHCTCTYPGCPRHGICCECIQYHRAKKQVPGCMFPTEAEATWDRSIARFISAWQEKGY